MLSAIVNINMGLTIYYMSGEMGVGGWDGMVAMLVGWICGDLDWECKRLKKKAPREGFTSHRSFLTGG
jgi:hypothetical protein